MRLPKCLPSMRATSKTSIGGVRRGTYAWLVLRWKMRGTNDLPPATYDELADYAEAGRIGNRISQRRGSKAGPWVFGLTVLSILAITSLQTCQRQVPTVPLGQPLVEQSTTKNPATTIPVRTEPSSPAILATPEVSALPAKPQAAPLTGGDDRAEVQSSRPEMWA